MLKGFLRSFFGFCRCLSISERNGFAATAGLLCGTSFIRPYATCFTNKCPGKGRDGGVSKLIRIFIPLVSVTINLDSILIAGQLD